MKLVQSQDQVECAVEEGLDQKGTFRMIVATISSIRPYRKF
jgi:hypothetical protein